LIHQLIRCIVYGESKETAVAQARTNLEQLTKDGRPYDYFVTFEEDEPTCGVAGRDRFGDLPAAVEADSEKGQELVEQGWEHQREAYKNALEKIDEFFESADEPTKVVEETHEELIRHQMMKLGRYRGPPVFFYDHYGSGLTTKEDLDVALDAPNSENQNIWIVPADVHY